jgi:hypothetical protein
MVKLEDYRVEAEPNDKRANLIAPDKRCVTQLPGCVLERLYQLENRHYLVFLTDDSPYEECLHIVLLDENYHQLDQVDIFQAYTPGILSNLTVLGSYELEFEFMVSCRFRLSVDVSPRRRMHRLISSSPIHYPRFLAKSYMTVTPF